MPEAPLSPGSPARSPPLHAAVAFALTLLLAAAAWAQSGAAPDAKAWEATFVRADAYVHAARPDRASQMLGVDKKEIVRRFVADGRLVAFAGDGFPDADPARLVPGDLRFARGDLATVLRTEGLPFHAFETWSDIARVLLARGS